MTWFAPPSGGYNGLGPNGEVVPRPDTPPKTPATAAGVRLADIQAEHRKAGETWDRQRDHLTAEVERLRAEHLALRAVTTAVLSSLDCSTHGPDVVLARLLRDVLAKTA